MEYLLDIVLTAVIAGATSAFMTYAFSDYWEGQRRKEVGSQTEILKEIKEIVEEVLDRTDESNERIKDLGKGMGFQIECLKQDLKGQIDRHYELHSMAAESQGPKNNWEGMRKVFSRNKAE